MKSYNHRLATMWHKLLRQNYQDEDIEDVVEFAICSSHRPFAPCLFRFLKVVNFWADVSVFWAKFWSTFVEFWAACSDLLSLLSAQHCLICGLGGIWDVF